MRCRTSLVGCVCATLVLVIIVPAAQGLPTYNNDATGGISFGVSDYGGAPNVGAPTYIANNFTGRNDILASPGNGSLGGYLTANPTLANNTSSTGAGNLPVAWSQIGGGNINGNFGSGGAINNGAQVGVALVDSNAGGGAASYMVASTIGTYTDAAGTLAGNTYGAYVAMSGAVPNIGNAAVMAARVHLSSANGASPFLNGVDLPDMVLAISRNAAGNTLASYNVVGQGSAWAVQLTDGNNGLFKALAVSKNMLAVDIPAGDVITVTATLTAYADPASIDTMIPDNDLWTAAGASAPTITFLDTVVPEPGALVLLAMAPLFLMRRRHIAG